MHVYITVDYSTNSYYYKKKGSTSIYPCTATLAGEKKRRARKKQNELHNKKATKEKHTRQQNKNEHNTHQLIHPNQLKTIKQ